MARAVAAPRPEPPPVMRTATSFNCMGKNLSLGVFPVLWVFKAEPSSSGCRGNPFRVFGQHAAANQRFHMFDVLAADFVGDRPHASRARHRVPPEKQMVAG